MKGTISQTKYRRLLNDISSIYEATRRVIIRAYWEIGWLIVEVEQKGKYRAQYDTQLIERLSHDLTKKYGRGFSARNLRNMREFYYENQIWQTSAKLSWSKQVELLLIDDKDDRERLIRIIERKKLNVREVRALVRKENEKKRRRSKKKSVLTRPTDLRFDTYRKNETRHSSLTPGKKRIDCGLGVFKQVKKSKRINETIKPSYTYRATVERVIDGDTIVALVSLGLDSETCDIFRFRGINTPEIDTPEGKKAKRFVMRCLKKNQKIVIKTYRTDMYGRFVADILYLKDEDATFDEIKIKGLYLNQELLDVGLAIKW